MAALLFPNIAGDVQQGFDRGQKMAFNRLAGLAIQNPADARSYLAQAASINPQASLGVQAYLQNDAAQALKTQQAQQMLTAKKAGAAARYYESAVRSGDPAKKAAAATAVLPFLGEMAARQGKAPPTQADLESPAGMAGLDRVIAATAYLFPEKPIAVGPDTTLIQPSSGQVVYQGEGDAGSVVPGMTYNGMPVFRDKLGNLKDVRGNPIPQGDAQSGMGVDQAVPGIGANAGPAPETSSNVEFQFAPGTPQAVIDAIKAAAAASGDTTLPVSGAQPSGLQYTPSGGKALQAKIALARSMGATDAQIRAMVLGPNADPGESITKLLTPDGLALMDASIAHGYNMPMPSMGYGKAGTAAKADAINGLAAQFKQSGVSPDQAVSQMMMGNTTISGLRSLQHVNAKIAGFEQSAEKEADLALTASSKVGRSGSPLFNEWLLAGRQGLAGDTSVTRFNNAVNALAEDYARVIGGGNPAATDSSRALAHKMINSAMTAQQFQGVVDQMRQEMQARTAGLQSAVQSLRNAATSNEGSAVSGWPGQTPAPASSAAAPADSDFNALVKKWSGSGG